MGFTECVKEAEEPVVSKGRETGAEGAGEVEDEDIEGVFELTGDRAEGIEAVFKEARVARGGDPSV